MRRPREQFFPVILCNFIPVLTTGEPNYPVDSL